MERVPTGIPGFDELIEGGFPKGSNILITGTPGAGKTIFGLQFLKTGAEMGEPGIYLTFVDTRDKIILTGKRLGWDLEKYGDKLLILELNPEKPYQVLDYVKEKIDDIGAERLVFDTFTVLSLYAGTETIGIVATEVDRRREITNLVRYILRFHTTNLLISEAPREGIYSKDGIIEFLVDGIVVLYNYGHGERNFRALSIPKMRFTKQKFGLFPFEIVDGIGIRVLKEEGLRIEV